MLTVEQLRTWGANVDEALVRCLNNEAFYLKLTDKAIRDPNFERLAEAQVKNVSLTNFDGNLDKAFESAHALKGITANLALTPILKPVSEMTELLRSRTATDYSAMLKEVMDRRNELTKG